jgi:phosphoserine aminotransferase
MKNSTVHNFSAGPAALPKEVLLKAQKELLDFNGSGTSIMEVSHRGKLFDTVHNNALQDLRDLLSIPDEYAILFMQGGAIAQNSLIPLNLFGNNNNATYAITGSWSSKSATEAKRYGNVTVACESKPYLSVPDFNNWNIAQNSAYLHICTNETIDGIEFLDIESIKKRAVNIPIVADMSSHILSREINIADYGVIYAGAQKNIGPSGLTIAIVRKDLLNQAMPACPTALSWNTIYQNDSMYNTPPTFAIYMAGLVFQWLKQNGGIKHIEEKNILKANKLYTYIDNSSLYSNNIDKNYRSRMNVPFILKDETLNAKFLEQAELHNLVGLKGHKSVGGMRASIYNAVGIDGVDALIDFMQRFENSN